MISLGLSASDQRLFEQSLLQSHQVDFRVRATDLSHNLIEDLSDRFIDGQVNVDQNQEVTRDASLTLESRSLFSFENGNLSTGAAFAQVMIEIDYGVNSDLLNRWIWVPVFAGPVTSFQRQDDQVTLAASGKENLLLKAINWRGKTYPKGTRKTDLIRDVLQSHGETRLDIPEWPDKTDRVYSTDPSALLWQMIVSLGHSWGSGTMEYDGRGHCKLFHPNQNVRWTFTDGDGGSITTEPQVTYTLGSDFVNACRVYGPTPAKGKKQIFAEYVAPASHPLSPSGLSRNGCSTYYAVINRDSDVTDQKSANALAKKTVDDGLLGATEASFSSVPIPHLEPWDVVRLKTGAYDTKFVLKTFTLPLNAESAMTVGYNAKVSNWKKHGRRTL